MEYYIQSVRASGILKYFSFWNSTGSPLSIIKHVAERDRVSDLLDGKGELQNGIAFFKYRALYPLCLLWGVRYTLPCAYFLTSLLSLLVFPNSFTRRYRKWHGDPTFGGSKKKNENRIGERTLTFCNCVAKYLINKGLVGWRKMLRLNGLNIGSLFFIPAFFYLG